MAGINEEARIPVYINDEQAKSALKTLQNEADKWKRKMYEAMAGGDLKGVKEAEREIKKVTKQTNELKREAFDVNKVLSNLSSASTKDMRKAIQLLEREMSGLTRKTKEYTDKEKQVQKLKTELYGVNTQLRTQQSLTSRVANGFNKYFGMATAALASLGGVALTIKSATQAYAQFDDKLSDVMKTTGLTKDRVKALNAELEELDTRTAQENLLDLARVAGKLGITAEEEIMGFVRAADKINVALAEDLGGNTEQAINQLGKLVDIFKLKDKFGIEESLLKIGSAINSLGAAGTANELYLVEFSKRVAGIAPIAGISIQQVLGLGATLDELGQTSEVSGTTFAKLMGNMFKKTGEYAKLAGMDISSFTKLLNEDANEAFIKVLEGAKGSGTGFSELAKNLEKLGLDGARSTAVLGVLASNLDKLREKQAFSNLEFEKGTSILDEYNIKNTNAQARLEKARKAFAEVQRELGERLAPAYASVIHKGSLTVKMLGKAVEFLFEHRKALTLAAVAIGSYTVALNIANWATKLYNAVTTAATAITKGFNTAVKANPVGLIISLLTTAATAFYLFGQKADAAKKSQKEFNDEIARGNELLGQSKTLEERASIVKNLSKEQLENLRSDLAIQIREEENFHATLLQKLKKRLETDNELKELSERRSQEGITEMQKININAQITARQRLLSMELEAENKTNQQRLKNLKAHQANVTTELKNRPADPDAPATGGESNLEKIKKALDSEAAAAQNAIKQQLLERLITEDQAKDAMLASEIEFLEKKKALQIKYKDDYLATESSLIDKKLQQAKEADKLTAEEKKKANAKTLQELANKEAEELNVIKKQLADKLITSEQAQQEILLKEIEFLNQRIALKVQWGEDTAELEGKILDKTNKIAENALKADEDRARQLADLRKEFEDEEILKAQEKAAALAELDTLHKAGMLESEEEYQRLKTNIVEKYEGNRFEKTSHYLSAANDLLSGAASFFADMKDAELAKAGDNALERARIEEEYAEKQKKVAIGQAVIAGAMAIMELWASKSVLPEPANSIYKGVMTAVIGGTTIAQIAKIKSTSFAEGGYTGPGGKYEPAGIVHKKEYVVPEEGTDNPSVRMFTDIFEIARRNGSLARLNLSQIMQAIPARGYASGGYSGGSSILPPSGGVPAAGGGGGSFADPEIKQLIHLVINMTKEIRENPPRLPIDQFERARTKYIEMKQTSGL